MLNQPSLQNKMTDVVIQQHSRKLLMMDILMPETCWAHKKWNKIASDIKLVFYSSTITMMHGPVNIRYKQIKLCWQSRIMAVTSQYTKQCEKFLFDYVAAA